MHGIPDEFRRAQAAAGVDGESAAIHEFDGRFYTVVIMELGYVSLRQAQGEANFLES